jgi:hypothetical protein
VFPILPSEVSFLSPHPRRLSLMPPSGLHGSRIAPEHPFDSTIGIPILSLGPALVAHSPSQRGRSV